MATQTFPSITPSSQSWGLMTNARQFISPLTGAIQTSQRTGNRWQVSLTFDNLTTTQRRTLQAFLARVQGLSENFYLTDHAFIRSADGAGTPLVNGADQTGNSLITDGWTGSYAMRAGDLFSVNGELKIATADSTISGGAATIAFAPELRAAPANDAAITRASPTGIFRLSTPISSWSTAPGPIASTFTIEAVEDVIA